MNTTTKLSVIVCTYNPADRSIETCLSALAGQTLDRKHYELIVVDNNSPKPLKENVLRRLSGSNLSVVREVRQGLVYARCGGLYAAKADLLCYVDDDNELSPNYLETVLKIAEAEPQLGVWGGVCEGRFTRHVGPFQTPWLPHLGVRDMGPKPLTGAGDSWGPWEPIGAGICVRRDVANGYAKYVESGEVAGLLGRKGKALMSGEDSLLSRVAHLLGYKVGYRPDLHLFHHIADGRLNLNYLARLMEGHGRSFYQLMNINGETEKPLSHKEIKKEIYSRFLYRCKKEGIRTALGMRHWDRGYFLQVQENHGKPAPQTLNDILIAN